MSLRIALLLLSPHTSKDKVTHTNALRKINAKKKKKGTNSAHSFFTSRDVEDGKYVCVPTGNPTAFNIHAHSFDFSGGR